MEPEQIDDILTVEQVAEILEFHPKTVRRFIREGRLKAVKIGKQWRILERDLRELTGQNEEKIHPEGAVAAPEEPREKVQISSVVDVFVEDEEEALRISNMIFAVLNCEDPAYGKARVDYVFYNKELRARFLFWGNAHFMKDILELIGRISN